MKNFLGFIDGTVISISRSYSTEQQNVAYNGHKRRHVMKFKVFMTQDGLIQH